MSGKKNKKEIAISSEQTPANIKSPQNTVVKTLEQEVNSEIVKLIPKVGTIKTTKKQQGILATPVKNEEVEIRPDGIVYLPWPFYVRVLREAFGSSWAMIPDGRPKMENNLIIQAWWLMIDGCPYGWAVGQQEYYPTNAQMTYGDAIEGAKSNARMRLCKDFGISMELWMPAWVKIWKEKYAESYWDPKAWSKKDNAYTGAYRWRKKGSQATKSKPKAAIPKQPKTSKPQPKKKVPKKPVKSKPAVKSLSEEQIKLIGKLKKSHIWAKTDLIAIDKDIAKGVNIIDSMQATINKRKKMEKWIGEEANAPIEINGYLLKFLTETANPDIVRKIPDIIKQWANEKTKSEVNAYIHEQLTDDKQYIKYIQEGK